MAITLTFSLASGVAERSFITSCNYGEVSFGSSSVGIINKETIMLLSLLVLLNRKKL